MFATQICALTHLLCHFFSPLNIFSLHNFISLASFLLASFKCKLTFVLMTPVNQIKSPFFLSLTMSLHACFCSVISIYLVYFINTYTFEYTELSWMISIKRKYILCNNSSPISLFKCNFFSVGFFFENNFDVHFFGWEIYS